MTVSSSTNRVSYSGNGSLTAFAYTFKVFDESDLTVILRASDGTETVQTITTHYTVSGVGDAGGGNVTFGTAPASGVTVVILREQPLTQGLDLVPNDPFPANSLEEALDKIVFMTQKHEEELGRAIKASRTNVITGSEFTISASDRANKIFAFDSSGDVSITQEIGTFRGNWAASTAYEVRDLVKDTSTNNIFIVNSAHTSSGAQPLTTNANSAKYDLIVDAASATTSATNAAASATSASNAQTAAETAQTAAETAQTAAETALDNFDDRYLGAKSSDPTVDNDGDALITGALYFNTTSGMKVYDGSSWDDVKPTTAEQTNIDAVAGDASDIGTVATDIANVNTVAGISSDVTTVSGISANVTTVAGISANVTTVAGDSANISTVATNITDVNSFANRYKISATAPSSPSEGTLWFDTTNDLMKAYDGSSFVTTGSTVNGTSSRNVYTATGGQTAFSATYDVGFVDVYLNGAKLQVTTDFTATDGTTVTLTSGATAGDIVDIVAYGTFELADVYTKTDSDARYINQSHTGNVTIDGNVTVDQLDILAQGDLRLQDSAGGQYVALQAPATISSNYTLTLPTADGSANQILKTDGSGNLGFIDSASVWALVDEVTVSSNVNEVELTGIDGTYKHYVIIANEVSVTSGVQTHMLFKQGGSYATSGYYYSATFMYSGNAVVTASINENDTKVDIAKTSAPRHVWYIDLWNPNANSVTNFYSRFSGNDGTTTYQANVVGGLTTAGQVTAVKFDPDNRQYSAGNFKLYGIGG